MSSSTGALKLIGGPSAASHAVQLSLAAGDSSSEFAKAGSIFLSSGGSDAIERGSSGSLSVLSGISFVFITQGIVAVSPIL